MVAFPECPNLTRENCTVMEKGSFELNPDLAGIGIAHFIITITAVVLVAVFLWLATTGYLVWSRTGDEDAPFLFNKGLVYYKRVFEKAAHSLGDYQLITAIAYLFCLKATVLRCSISAYHYNVVNAIVVGTTATHVAAVCIIDGYFGHWVLSFIRLVAIGGLIGLGGENLLERMIEGGGYFPTAVPESFSHPAENDTSQQMLYFPTSCYRDRTTPLLTEKSFQSFFGPNRPYNPSAGGRHIADFVMWCILVFGYILAINMTYIKYRTRRSNGSKEKKRTVYRALWCTQFLVCSMGTVISSLQLKYMYALRQWVSRSEYWKLGIYGEGGANPEAEFVTFGQLLPLLSLVLIAYNILESFCNEEAPGKIRVNGSKGPPSTHDYEAVPGKLGQLE